MTISTHSAKSFALTFTASLLLFACVNTPSSPKLPSAKAATAALEAAPQATDYMLQVGDVLDIKLMQNPELNDEATVRPDGKISTTLASDIMAAGRTPKDVQADLEEAYKEQLVKPRVGVIVRSFAPTRVYVTGEVTNPGEFVTVGPNLTLLQSIARAGGLKNTAGAEKIIIIRRAANDAPKALQANYSAAASGIDPASDVRLAAYDVVYVPRSDVANAYLNFQQYVQQFVPINFGAAYQINPTTTVR